jgi:ubiquinone/menaquinone biosynthesis C-methylase UbiE
MTEWLTSALDLQPGMRVLDLGCGRAVSSIFLHREFGVQVWATDLWFSVSENSQRIRDAGVEDGVFPIHADARSLPYADDFFDAIVSIDSFPYYGTDDTYLNYLARFVKPGGPIGIAGAGLMQEIEGPIPEHLRNWWTPDLWCLHSAPWWRRHWEKTGISWTSNSPTPCPTAGNAGSTGTTSSHPTTQSRSPQLKPTVADISATFASLAIAIPTSTWAIKSCPYPRSTPKSRYSAARNNPYSGGTTSLGPSCARAITAIVRASGNPTTLK